MNTNDTGATHPDRLTAVLDLPGSRMDTIRRKFVFLTSDGTSWLRYRAAREGRLASIAAHPAGKGRQS